jgi:hypothetical protein
VKAVRSRLIIPLLLVGGGLGACGALGPSPTASEAAASASPSAAASVGGESPVSVEILGEAPVLEGSAVNDDWVLPGALAFDEGTYHLWGAAFAQETEEHHGYYASSPDGVTWTVDPVDPLADFDWDLSRPGPIPTSALELADGTWAMYIWGVPAPHERGAKIWRATAPSPEGPWVGDLEPVIEGTAGTWDGGGLDFPSVVATDDGYLMVYTGVGITTFNEGNLGVATSPDGMTWTKEDGPAIEPGHCGEWDARSIVQPRLLTGEGSYLLLYAGQPEGTDPPAIGASLSADGLTWNCASSLPVLVAEGIPGSEGIHTVAAADGATGPELLVESLGDGFSALWLGDVQID